MNAKLRDTLVRIATPLATIEGRLEIPEDGRGLVIFAHGSGSSRFSPRNNFVAGKLREAGLGTLLLDLLTPTEDAGPAGRFDIALLTERLVAVVRHLSNDPETEGLPLGVFGASTGAAAALCLAVAVPERIGAVVSRGGRPDLAGERALAGVRAPTLLIVGGLDVQVLELNQEAYRHLACTKEFTVVPGATHLFEEPGALERVATLAAAWFCRHLGAATPLGSLPGEEPSPGH